jgi:hypothetical protein
MGPRIVRKGGQICVLLGCSIPLLLRKGEENSSYHVIGECYLDIFMNGEVLDEVGNAMFSIEIFELS